MVGALRVQRGSWHVVFAMRWKKIPASTTDRGGGALRRKPGIGFSILTGLAAFLEQTLAGLRHTPTPIDSQQAESKISAADVGAVTVACGWCILQTTLIARPWFGAPV